MRQVLAALRAGQARRLRRAAAYRKRVGDPVDVLSTLLPMPESDLGVMSTLERITWHLDANTFGGVLMERVLAAIETAPGLYAGLVFNLSTTGKPTIEYWERIDDLERAGFVPISATKARAICDALPCFLERLERLEGAERAQEAPEG